MFKEKYTRDVEKIKVEGSLKRYVKAKMRQEKSSKRSSLKSVAVLAATVCVCVVASLLITPKNATSVVDPIAEKKDKVLLPGMKYADIYDAIELARKSGSNVIYDGDAEDLGTTGTASKPAGMKPSTNNDTVLTPETDDSSSDKPLHSTTNNQVAGVDEIDIVKTDGEYIYTANRNTIKIAKALEGQLELVYSIEIEENYSIRGLFLWSNKLAVVLSEQVTGTKINSQKTVLRVYDLTDKTNPQRLGEVTQSGNYYNSRMIDGAVYLLSNYYVGADIKKEEPTTFVPTIDNELLKESSITCINNFTSSNYLVISAINVDEIKVTAEKAILGGAENIYCDDDSLYFTFTKNKTINENETVNTSYIVKLGLSKNAVKTEAMGEVSGRPLNQFSMDEYEGNLRIVTTVQKGKQERNDDGVSGVVSYTAEKYNALYVLDKNLKVIGKIEDLAPDENVYSVRFDGKTGYFVTFKQVDPLFTVDLSNPTQPTVLSELKIPGFSEYLHPFGEGKLFGFGQSATEEGRTNGLKLSMFDVSNPADVSEENVTVLESAFSEASSNHKAIMVDENKNIIAFAAMNYKGEANVYIYGYDKDNGFFLKATTPIGKADLTAARFIWIDDYFYLVHGFGINSFDLETFNEVSKITF